VCWCIVPEKKYKSRDHYKHKSKNSSSNGTECGETSVCLHSGEWRAIPAPFINCISGFIVLLYYEVKRRLRFKMNII
jgi:hypothetical protein